MNDTPETDDLARGNHVVPTEWAQQLERERDEARKRIERQRFEIVRLNGATNHAGGTPLKIALRQRDEAREKAERYRLDANALMLQRDEARDAFVIATDQMVQAQCKLRESNTERDEAREVLKRIAHASMSARHKEEDYAEWEKAVESLQGICEEKNFINE